MPLAKTSRVAAGPPPDGTYLSQAGVQVRVTRRPVRGGASGSVEIALHYGRGGAAREFYCLEHHADTPARVTQVFDQFIDDISPLGEPYRVRSEAQKRAFVRIRSVKMARSKACSTPDPFSTDRGKITEANRAGEIRDTLLPKRSRRPRRST